MRSTGWECQLAYTIYTRKWLEKQKIEARNKVHEQLINTRKGTVCLWLKSVMFTHLRQTIASFRANRRLGHVAWVHNVASVGFVVKGVR